MKSQSTAAERRCREKRPFRSMVTARRLLNFLIAAGGHWIFQSMLYMDSSERRFKLALDALLTIFFALVLGFWRSWPMAILVGLILAHTVNFIFNAQLCALGANYGLVHLDSRRLNRYAQALGRRAKHDPSIEYAAVCGSLAQNNDDSASDLDVRILRRPGLGNGIRAGWFVLRERSQAQFEWFPLDIYVFDSEETLRCKLKSHEILTYLPDVTNKTEDAYALSSH